MTASPAPHSLLPLTNTVLHVLLSLADGDKHGYAIIKEVRRRTSGDVELGASSLYAVLKRLDDERRRYYRLSRFGRAVAVAELQRLEAILAQGRAKRLVPAPKG
jgi:DNA-binding PadR family transcriptional regulator